MNISVRNFMATQTLYSLVMAKSVNCDIDENEVIHLIPEAYKIADAMIEYDRTYPDESGEVKNQLPLM